MVRASGTASGYLFGILTQPFPLSLPSFPPFMPRYLWGTYYVLGTVCGMIIAFSTAISRTRVQTAALLGDTKLRRQGAR